MSGLLKSTIDDDLKELHTRQRSQLHVNFKGCINFKSAILQKLYQF